MPGETSGTSGASHAVEDFDEAEAATIAPASPVVPQEFPSHPLPPEDDGAPWPSDATIDATFLSEVRSRGEALGAPPAADAPTPRASPSAADVAEPTDKAKLPPLDALVARLRPELMGALEELFRARFYDVKKVRKADLKSAAPPPPSGD